MKKFSRIDEYMLAQPIDAQKRLKSLRKIIRQAAPQAEEAISYNMPAVKSNGILVWYAAFKKHIGLYPKASAIVAFKRNLAGYETSKGAIRFPLEEPIPSTLVTKIVKFRLRENARDRKKRGKPPGVV